MNPEHEIETGARLDEQGRLCIVIAHSQVGLRIGPWASGLEVEHIEEGRWVRGDFQEDAPLLDWAKGDPLVAEFVATIPESIRRRAFWFAYRQLPTLRLLCAVPEAESLLDDNPLLLVLLASGLAFLGKAPRAGRALVLGPRSEILAFTTGARSKAALRVLSRLRFHRVGAAELNSTWELLKRPDLIAILCRLSSVRGDLLPALVARPYIIQFTTVLRLLDGSATNSDSYTSLWRLAATFRDLERMAIDLAHPDPKAAYRACVTTDDVERLHERWILRLSARSVADRATALERQYGTWLLPPPPIPGSDSIVPLRTLDELLAEGLAMRHCVGSYHSKVMARQTALYAVHAPQRATLEVEMLPSGPVVRQLRLFANGEPSEATRHAVRTWLDEYGAEQDCKPH